ncbi:MAG TPA: urea amidolyase associated protein UAAP2 [Polyangiales bacterium]
MTLPLTESRLSPAQAAVRDVIEAGRGYSRVIKRGSVLRIVDLEGNQAVDTLFYNAHEPSERYSATATIVAQNNLYLTTGTRLISSEGNTLLTIVADTCGRHDTLGGACAAESNQVRYAIEKRYMHSCRDSFLLECALHQPRLSKRDLTSNINFFMNVPVTEEGGLCFADGVSGAGRYVELRAEMDVLLVISNCPQLNNPCNAYNPTPVEVVVFEPEQVKA